MLAASGESSSAQPLRDVAGDVGLVFRHHDHRAGLKHYVETAASGGGFLDFDGDGDLDVYLIQGAPTPGAADRARRTNTLFENRGGAFVDVTARVGVGDDGYGMGMCVGDVDGDGRVDFLVTNWGPDRLYRNRGNGTFEEIGARAGVADARWSTGCAFGDFDGDGDHDLYVARYVDFQPDRSPWCGDRARGIRAYCRPEAFAGVDDSLYINDGRGRFVDQAAQRGIARGRDEKGFGVLASDLDDDGDLDIYVANDGTPNRHYVNRGDGRFEDQGVLLGTALSNMGASQAGMGVAAGDLDGDGRFELMVTNYSTEPNNLYRDVGGLWEDAASPRGLARPSWPHVGWGVAFFDLDNDADLDAAVANGHAVDNIEVFEAGLSYEQPNQLFANDGSGRFVEIPPATAGPPFAVRRVSRGLAGGDFDADGRVDLLVTNTNGPAELLRNETPLNGRHWVGLRLRDGGDGVETIGARVSLRIGDRRLVQEVRSGGSFLSQHALALHFGIDGHSGPIDVEVRWPDGAVQRERLTVVDRWQVLERKVPKAKRHRGG